MNYTNEQIIKAKAAKSADELLEMAKASGIEMTADEAKKYFAELNKQGELSDDELASVAGGKGDDDDPYKVTSTTKYSVYCPFCTNTFEVVRTTYAGVASTLDPEYCGCSARIALNPDTSYAYFSRDGKSDSTYARRAD